MAAFPLVAITGDLILDNRLTQRLVGVAVIAALAVIFVPGMLEKQNPPSVAPRVRQMASTPNFSRFMSMNAIISSWGGRVPLRKTLRLLSGSR